MADNYSDNARRTAAARVRQGARETEIKTRKTVHVTYTCLHVQKRPLENNNLITV